MVKNVNISSSKTSLAILRNDWIDIVNRSDHF